MSDNLLAALLGGLSSALRFERQGYLHMFRIFISSACLAFFAGSDLADFLKNHFDIVVSYGAVCFILAYCGSTILDRFILLIKAFQVSKRWNS